MISVEFVVRYWSQVPLATAQGNTAVSLLGAGARCYWKNSAVFQVIFGFNGAITVNQAPPAALRLRPGVVFAYGAPSYATDGEILVETPATPWPIPYSAETVEPQPYADSPKVYLQGPTVVGFCDKLVIITHIPWAAGSRHKGLIFSWSSDPDLPVILSVDLALFFISSFNHHRTLELVF